MTLDFGPTVTAQAVQNDIQVLVRRLAFVALPLARADLAVLPLFRPQRATRRTLASEVITLPVVTRCSSATSCSLNAVRVSTRFPRRMKSCC